MRAAFVLKDRSDQELLMGLRAAVGREREDLAAVIAHLAEMERRDLALPEGCSSLSKYCIDVLNLSERQAYRRVDVARRARQFPIILEMLADGLVNITAVYRLGPSLTKENHVALLTEATHMTCEEIEEMVARLRPKPPVHSMMRRLPAPLVEAAPAGASFFGHGTPVTEATTPPPVDGIPVTEATIPPPIDDTPARQDAKSTQRNPEPRAEAEPARTALSHKPAISPLAPEMYKIQFTVNTKTRLKLKQLQEMMSHRIPNGDVGKIIELGIDLLYEQVSRQRFGKTKRAPKKRLQNAPEAAAEKKLGATQEKVSTSQRQVSASQERVGASQETLRASRERLPANQGKLGASHEENGHSRNIPAAVKRDVWERDQGSCAFVSKNGRRCSERNRIEYHHVVPFAWGGESTVGNIELRCRAHNAYEGEAIFGRVVKNNGAKDNRAATGPGTGSKNGNGRGNENGSRGGPLSPTGPKTSSNDERGHTNEVPVQGNSSTIGSANENGKGTETGPGNNLSRQLVPGPVELRGSGGPEVCSHHGVREPFLDLEQVLEAGCGREALAGKIRAAVLR